MTAAPRRRAVIFDLDGTLVDTLDDLADAMNRVLAAEGAPQHDREGYRRMVGRGTRRLVEDALPSGRRDEATLARCHALLLADYGEHCLVETRPYAGIPEALAELRAAGLKLAVCSNKDEALTRRIVDALFGEHAFEAVAGALPGRPLKPDPAGPLLLAAQLGISPAATAYVGDSDIDMRTAVAAGMRPVGVAWGFRSREELLGSGAAAVAERPSEIPALCR